MTSVIRGKDNAMKNWALQDAKARFSALVEKAQNDGPQLVTRRGQEAVYVVAATQFRELTRCRGEQDLVRFFRDSPLSDLPHDWFRRDTGAEREISL